MKWWQGLVGFFKALVRGPQPQGRVEDSAEMETEIERRRGMRGD